MSRAENKRRNDDDDELDDEPSYADKYGAKQVAGGKTGGGFVGGGGAGGVAVGNPSSDATRREFQSKDEVSRRQQQKEIDDFGSDSSSWGRNSSSSNSHLAESKRDEPPTSGGMFSNFFKGKSGDEDAKVDYNTLRDSVMRPRAAGGAGIDRDSFINCYIDRDDSLLGAQTFRCYLEGNDKQKTQRILTARKETAKKTCYYLISMDDDGDRASPNLIGKMRGQDFISSQYLITDSGMSYKTANLPSSFRKEYGVIFLEYESNRPSSYKIYIPRVNHSQAIVWQPGSDEQTMPVKIAENKTDNLTKLVNKQPKWDVKLQAHVLNFQGRVKEASIKNFQLCIEADGSTSDEVVLQFGKVSKDRFCMDVKSPLSLFQAFAICISMLDKGKLADRKGYEFMSRMSGNSRDSAPVASAASNTSNNSNNNTSDSLRDDKNSESSGGKTVEVTGSMQGSTSIGGWISQNAPSMDYLKNKFSRNSK